MMATHPVSYIRETTSRNPLAAAFVISENTQYGCALIGVHILRGRTVFSDFTDEKNVITAVLEVDSAADHYVACMIIASHDMNGSNLLRGIWPIRTASRIGWSSSFILTRQARKMTGLVGIM